MFTNIPWRLMMIETFVMGALCCICTHDHPQSHFCRRGLVLKVNIHEELKVSLPKGFLVEITEVFKGHVRELNLILNGTAVLEMNPECPVDSIKTGDTYVIFGDSRNGNLYTKDCYGSMPWKNTTQFLKLGLARNYKRNCDCYPNPEDYAMHKHCKYNYSLLKVSGKECKWVNNRNVRLCTMGLLNGIGENIRHAYTRSCLDFLIEPTYIVLKVKIHEEIKSPSTKSFRMEIKKVFKRDLGDSTLIHNKSATLEMDLECPVDSMKTGDKYLIFGDRLERTISTATCYGNLPWKKTIAFYRMAKHYNENCDCALESEDISKQNHCGWNYSFMRKSGTNCRWAKTTYYNLCKKGLLKCTH